MSVIIGKRNLFSRYRDEIVCWLGTETRGPVNGRCAAKNHRFGKKYFYFFFRRFRRNESGSHDVFSAFYNVHCESRRTLATYVLTKRVLSFFFFSPDLSPPYVFFGTPRKSFSYYS